MLTADTITDAQIRELQRSVAGYAFPASGMAHTELSEVWETCNAALYSLDEGAGSMDRLRATYKARARCAEILNARRSP